jgi:hypothetical protein
LARYLFSCAGLFLCFELFALYSCTFEIYVRNFNFVNQLAFYIFLLPNFYRTWASAKKKFRNVPTLQFFPASATDPIHILSNRARISDAVGREAAVGPCRCKAPRPNAFAGYPTPLTVPCPDSTPPRLSLLCYDLSPDLARLSNETPVREGNPKRCTAEGATGGVLLGGCGGRRRWLQPASLWS